MNTRILASLSACVFPLQMQLPLDSVQRTCYSVSEMTVLYGLQNFKPEYVAQILPPPPENYPVTLPEETDPLMRVLLRDLTDNEIELITRRTSDKVQAFWAAEFAKRGGAYMPVEVRMIPSVKSKKEAEDVYEESGTRFVDGVIYVDSADIKASSATWMYARGSAIALWVAHEIGHYVMKVTGVRDDAYARAIIEPGDTSEAAQKSPEELHLGGKSERLPGHPEQPVEVYVEQQAQYLAGLALREAGLLRKGDPEQLYYISVTQGNDYGRVTLMTPPPIPLPLSPVFFRRRASHGWGKYMAKAAFEGMLPSGSVESGLRRLGSEPNFRTLNPR